MMQPCLVDMTDNEVIHVSIQDNYWHGIRALHRVPTAAATAKSLQSYPTLCDPIDSSPPGSPSPGILQARTLQWVAISFSNPWKWKVKVKLCSRVRPSATPWTEAFQAPPSLGFSRQEYWSGVPLPSPRVATIRLKWSGTKIHHLPSIYSDTCLSVRFYHQLQI